MRSGNRLCRFFRGMAVFLAKRLFGEKNWLCRFFRGMAVFSHTLFAGSKEIISEYKARNNDKKGQKSIFYK